MEKISLQAILGDKTLLALMRFKFVPLSFILQKCSLPFNLKNATDVIQEFDSLGSVTAESDGFQVNVVNLKPQYQVIGKVLHVSAGISGSTGNRKIISAQEAIDLLKIKEISINTSARDYATEFNRNIYKPFQSQYEAYDKVVKDCDKSTNIDDVLTKHGLSKDEWKKLKTSIARYGLSREIRLAKMYLLEGSLSDEIERRYIGKSVQEVVATMVRAALVNH